MQMNQDADNISQWQTSLDKVYDVYPHPKWTWIAIEPWTIDLQTKYVNDSIGGGLGFGTGTQGFMVASNSKHQDRAIRQIDYYNSDYFQRLLWYGKEGKYHTVNEKGHPVTTSAYDLTKQGESGLSWPYYFRQDWYKRVYDYYLSVNKFPMQAKALELAGNYYQDLSGFSGVTNFPPDSDELKIFALIKEEYSNQVVKIIAGDPGNVDSAYNDLMATLNKLGLQKLNDYLAGFKKEKDAKFAKYGADLSLPK